MSLVTSKGADVDVSNAIIFQPGKKFVFDDTMRNRLCLKLHIEIFLLLLCLDSDDYENEIITDHRPIYVDDDDSLNRLSSVTEGIDTKNNIC